VLDTDTKGTGARMVPLEDALEKAQPKPAPSPPRKPPAPVSPRPKTGASKRPKAGGETRLTQLPPGHVRKKSTGEIGRVKSVDPKAGTATVTWLRQGRTSTVPISSITRK
jgi:hypothetical protein